MDLAHGAQAFTEDWSGLYECPVVCTESLAFDVTTSRTVHKILSEGRGRLIDDEGMSWFGLTVECTTVIQCLQNGIRCFLCGWFSLSPYGYGQQYARFNIGETLHSPDLISDIPSRLQRFEPRRAEILNLSPVVETEELRLLLTHSQTASPVRLHS